MKIFLSPINFRIFGVSSVNLKIFMTKESRSSPLYHTGLATQSHVTKHVTPSKPGNAGPVFCGTGEFMIDKGPFVMTGEITYKIAWSPSSLQFEYVRRKVQ
jgi:hypothetical protein